MLNAYWYLSVYINSLNKHHCISDHVLATVQSSCYWLCLICVMIQYTVTTFKAPVHAKLRSCSGEDVAHWTGWHMCTNHSFLRVSLTLICWCCPFVYAQRHAGADGNWCPNQGKPWCTYLVGTDVAITAASMNVTLKQLPESAEPGEQPASSWLAQQRGSLKAKIPLNYQFNFPF